MGSIKKVVKEARDEYLEKTKPLFTKLATLRMEQTIKYLYNPLNNTLSPIKHETKEESIILKKN